VHGPRIAHRCRAPDSGTHERQRVKTDGSSTIEWISPERAGFYDEVLRFARSLPDDARENDRTETFPRDSWLRCGSFGIPGLPAPGKYGGNDADVVTTMLALEALGYGCTDAGLVFSINAHMWTSVVPVMTFGTDEQKERWLPGLCDGTRIGCHAITEPGAGSDVFSLTTSGTPVEGGHVLKGTKMFITNAPVADLLIVFARTTNGVGPYGITAFALERDHPGLAVGPALDKMGLRTSPMSEVVLDDCFVADDAMLGRPGQGGEIFTTSMRWERACIMASQVGMMRRTMDRCIAYARQRRQFGKAIAKFESVSDKIVDMKIAIDASRALVLRVGWLMDNGHDGMVEAAVAKAYVAEANVKTHLDAIQIHGGYGYMTESELERHLRDAVGSKIYSGTTEIQKRIVARGLGL
jgi:alkylation response protein AidB-like acyl-CoA dehydrogenase